MFNYVIYFFVCIIFLFTSCVGKENIDNTSNTIEYPILFTVDNIDIDDSKLFVIENLSNNEINFMGIFSQFIPQLQNDLTVEALEFPFEKIELVSDTEIKVSSMQSSSSELILPYENNNNLLKIFTNQSNNEFFYLEYNQINQTLKYCILSYFYSFKNSFNSQIDYSPLIIEECQTNDFVELSKLIKNENNLEVNDTVAINLSYLVFN